MPHPLPHPLHRTLAVCAVLFVVSTLHAHPGHSLEDEEQDPAILIQGGEVRNQVKIEVNGGFRTVTSNGIPDHPTGRFPNRGNPNRIQPQQYRFRMPLDPQPGGRAIRSPHLFGVALNGVVFDPGTAEFWNNDRRWNYEALSGKIDLGVDDNNAHVQPTGAYHYHGLPTGLIQSLAGRTLGKQMTLVGWAADGFPIYAVYGFAEADNIKSELKKLRSSYRLKQGQRPDEPEGPGGKYDGTFTADYEFVEGLGDLDECNGRTGVTPEFPDGTYYYVLTDRYPFIPRLFRGEPDDSFQRQGMGPGGRPGPRGPRSGGAPRERPL